MGSRTCIACLALLVWLTSTCSPASDFQFFTEYGFAESIHTDEDKSEWPDQVPPDTPDVVLAGPDWMLAIEAKMLHNPSADDVRKQMARQSAVVDLWRTKRELPHRRVKHVLLLPARLAERVGPLGYDVLTWEKVLDSYAAVGPQYWVNLLGVALQRHEELESLPLPFAPTRTTYSPVPRLSRPMRPVAQTSMLSAEVVGSRGRDLSPTHGQEPGGQSSTRCGREDPPTTTGSRSPASSPQLHNRMSLRERMVRAEQVARGDLR